MTQKSDLGKLGEDLACQYLIKKNYKIIERNFRQKWGELDIIAKAPDKILVFIEVKTMQKSGEQGLKPEDQMTVAKIKKFKKTACFYAGSRPELINEKKGWRLDLLTLTLRQDSGSRLSSSNALTINDKNCDIRHFENI